MRVELTSQGPLVNGHEATLIGSGMHRLVYRVADVVVKVAIGEEAYNSAEREAAFYQRVAKTPHSRYFAPVLAHDQKWVVQRFIKSAKRDRTDEDYAFVDSIAEKFELCDIHDDNWLIDADTDEPVIVDYEV